MSLNRNSVMLDRVQLDAILVQNFSDIFWMPSAPEACTARQINISIVHCVIIYTLSPHLQCKLSISPLIKSWNLYYKQALGNGLVRLAPVAALAAICGR